MWRFISERHAIKSKSGDFIAFVLHFYIWSLLHDHYFDELNVKPRGTRQLSVQPVVRIICTITARHGLLCSEMNFSLTFLTGEYFGSQKNKWIISRVELTVKWKWPDLNLVPVARIFNKTPLCGLFFTNKTECCAFFVCLFSLATRTMYMLDHDQVYNHSNCSSCTVH